MSGFALLVPAATPTEAPEKHRKALPRKIARHADLMPDRRPEAQLAIRAFNLGSEARATRSTSSEIADNLKLQTRSASSSRQFAAELRGSFFVQDYIRSR